MPHKNPFVGFRLTPEELVALDGFATSRGCSRSAAARTAISYGLPLAQHGQSINVQRLAMCIERIQASLDMIIHREHADAANRLEEIARARTEQFHGAR